MNTILLFVFPLANLLLQEDVPDLLPGLVRIALILTGIFLGILIILLAIFLFSASKETLANIRKMWEAGSGFKAIGKYVLEYAGVATISGFVVAMIPIVMGLVLTGMFFSVVILAITFWNSLFPDLAIDLPINPAPIDIPDISNP